MLHELQSDAINLLKELYHKKDRCTFRDEVAISGPAGSGKSTIISQFIKDGFDVMVAAPTHKACDVLRNKGVTDPQTIHSLMYEMRNETEYHPVFDENGEPVIDETTGEQQIDTVVVGQKWIPREEPINEMVIFEEASMIGQRMRKDISDFVESRAFVGDAFQLPPVKDADVFGQTEKDVELTHVYRIDESPPLALATAIRQGSEAYPHLFDIPVIQKTDETWQDIADSDGVVITWKNVTRQYVNKQIRYARGANSWVPELGDKIIFYETDKDLGIYNGLGGVVSKVISVDDFSVHLRIKTDAGELRSVNAVSDPFKGEIYKRPWRRSQDDPMHIEYAYAITCHKSQGSEWPNVYVIDEVQEQALRFGADQAKRWLYTAVTRTSDNLVIIR